MNRRHFIAATAAAIGAFTLDPERALYVPGQKSYFDMHGKRYEKLLEPGWHTGKITQVVIGGDGKILFTANIDGIRVDGNLLPSEYMVYRPGDKMNFLVTTARA